MTREQKKLLFFSGVIVVMVLAALFYFVWSNYIGRGTVIISADAPYVVEIFGGEQYICETDLCEITTSDGLVNLIIAKEGFSTLVKEVDVPLFGSIELPVEFEIVPTISKVESIPAKASPPDYEIIFDQDTGFYKLVRSGDQAQRTLVFFPKEIKKPLIFGSDKSALVIDRVATPSAIYRIDLVAKEKTRLSGVDFSGIEEGLWSPNGQYFLFTKADSNEYFILNFHGKIETLGIFKNTSRVAWSYAGELIFTTIQDLKSIAFIGPYKNYVEPQITQTTPGISFGSYHPDESSYSISGSFSEITALPEFIIPTGNGSAVFFKKDDGNFKVQFR